MDNYTYLLKSISVGKEDAPTNQLTKKQAKELLADIVKLMKVTSSKNGTYETSKYFMYVGGFPCAHIAIDNRAGTNRLFTIYSKQDFEKQKSKISFI